MRGEREGREGKGKEGKGKTYTSCIFQIA